ncbi:hypothetical protein Y1Q_0017945 [Alligator mississippiensis]|uniref:Uncharacterized protein n=1 Tax=Alligator mississippiensis TaxID=8496 RepID=A0A151MY02_ALLMI|nr:hypothetical protein Y1Q_0017945 [Alligator mississippiensis]
MQPSLPRLRKSLVIWWSTSTNQVQQQSGGRASGVNKRSSVSSIQQTCQGTKRVGQRRAGVSRPAGQF